MLCSRSEIGLWRLERWCWLKLEDAEAEDIVLGSELAKLELENVGIEPEKTEDIVLAGIADVVCSGWEGE